MKTILIDTNFYADIMLGQTQTADILRRAANILLCPIVAGELLYGFKNGGKEKQNLEQFERFVNLPSVRTVDITTETAQFFALVMSELKTAGTPLPTNDVWIAACAMEHAAAIATRNEHFKKIPNLLLAV